ncbi:uncharacterized protein BX664DRAFT_268352 [Halteromyces radiatus]|uniref:uncharacterized protein n=1 Tax=Halteromyces radiatus TaxID=101107 RepID=UPI00221E536F|nr:uncharacterized protein BX664DRAFT_268352 [Halteromyces radiatus]KAI8081386.1 hypothetical protein BX664DRAFT_268352 [Halteromyces radiatus]
MFVEPSPVPRFRNEPPAPPPSPPYLNVIVQPFNINNNNNNSAAETDENDNASSTRRHSLITDNEHSDIPTIFTTLPQQLYHGLDLRQQQQEEEQRRPRLVFTSPLHRGQTITFSLQNAIPDDHIIVYKFLTSNTNTERYFVRPSAGRMISGETHSDIMLFLNQVPPLAPGEVLKDKILVRWAVIQRGTQVEEWVNQLKESTRRKWLEMLLENWPDQVVERKTRISIRFV